jgi:hypothetical protein
MMKKFIFCDSDPSGSEERDICGEEYYRMLDLCFMHCTHISFRIPDSNARVIKKIPEELMKYRIPVPQNVADIYRYYQYGKVKNLESQLFYFPINEQVKGNIIRITDSIFKWTAYDNINNPEDPFFFRSDGSPFFISIIHEGECALCLTPEEEGKKELQSIVSHPYWNNDPAAWT